MYSKTTNSIFIKVRPNALEEQSDPKNRMYAFSYKIEIENHGSETVQLLDRHWIIHSNGVPYDEVKGEGVVGLQPILEKGEHFEYSSGAVIEDPVGSMHGTYTMRTSSGKIIEVEIPKFDLVYPTQLN